MNFTRLQHRGVFELFVGEEGIVKIAVTNGIDFVTIYMGKDTTGFNFWNDLIEAAYAAGVDVGYDKN